MLPTNETKRAVLSADNQPIEVGSTVFVVQDDHIVEHIAAAVGPERILFEQPEVNGPIGCRPDEAYAWLDAAECAGNLCVA